jgi:putative oxidoreductase
MASKSISRWTPQFLSMVRIVVGFLVVWHGMLKLFGYPTPEQQVPLISLLGLAGVIEFAGGLLVMVGLFTRPAALAIGIEMGISFLILNLPKGLLTVENDGEAALFYTFFFLFVAAAGAGAWGLDRLLSRNTVQGASQYFASSKASVMLALMRIAIAFMFFQHGTEKFLGYPGGRADHAWTTNARAWGGLMEFALSPLLAVGLFTQPIAFLLSGEMAVAYFLRWARLGIFGSLPRGEASIYFCWAFLFLFVAGGGSYAVDNIISRKRAKSASTVDVKEPDLTRA